jgi:DNA-binding MarR family transcriptional regulator
LKGLSDRWRSTYYVGFGFLNACFDGKCIIFHNIMLSMRGTELVARAWRLRFTVQAGDIEIDLEGATIQVDEQLAQLKAEHTWTVLLERIREAREQALEAAVNAAREAGLPERGSAFRALLENCALTRKPDQVLGAIHYLRDVENISDSPPRVVNDLFNDAGIDPPGNLSLYLNRLKERNFLVVPSGHDDKNRFAILTPEGRAHLDKRSGA